MAGGRRAPPDEDGADHRQWQPVGADHGAHGRHPDREDNEAVQRPAEVRQPGEGHRHGDGQLEDGEARIEARERRLGRASHRRPEHEVDQQADGQGGHAGQRHLAHRGEPGHQEPDQDQGDDDPDGAEEPQRGDEPAHPARRWCDELGEVELDRPVGLGQRDADHHQHGCDDHPQGIRGPPPGGAPTVRPQDQRAHPLGPRGAVSGGGRRHGGRVAVRGPPHDPHETGTVLPPLPEAAQPECPVSGGWARAHPGRGDRQPRDQALWPLPSIYINTIDLIRIMPYARPDGPRGSTPVTWLDTLPRRCTGPARGRYGSGSGG